MNARRTFRFPARMRLSRDRDFQSVFNARARHGAGPLLVYARPNELDHPRLGLTVSRRVGRSVVRNRIKRLLREAFRLERPNLPCCYDLVVVVRPHEALTLEAYRAVLLEAVNELDRRWKKRRSTNPKTGLANGDAPGRPPQR